MSMFMHFGIFLLEFDIFYYAISTFMTLTGMDVIKFEEYFAFTL